MSRQIRLKNRREAIRKDRERARRIALAAFAGVFVLGAAVLAVFSHGTWSGFRAFCKGIPRGAALELVRRAASDHAYVFEQDPEPAASEPDAFFIVRPSPDWPRALGCWLQARQGLVTQVGRWSPLTHAYRDPRARPER